MKNIDREYVGQQFAAAHKGMANGKRRTDWVPLPNDYGREVKICTALDLGHRYLSPEEQCEIVRDL